MNKICTSIEQSNKLIELGIDLNTADMYYPNRTDIQYQGALPIGMKHGNPLLSQEIPAWSLSALLELIPPYLGEFKDGIDFGFSKAMNGKWYSAHYIQLDNSGLATFSKTVTGETSVDAAFEMICWLKENGKI